MIHLAMHAQCSCTALPDLSTKHPAAKLVQWHCAGGWPQPQGQCTMLLYDTCDMLDDMLQVTLQCMASRDPSHQAQTAPAWGWYLPCGAMSQDVNTSSCIYRKIPSNTSTQTDCITQSPWKASRKQQEPTTVTSRGHCP